MTPYNEIINNFDWEGPFEWETAQKKDRDCHVLYQIYGFHRAYGKVGGEEMTKHRG